MKVNAGKVDRTVRVVAGLGLIAAAATGGVGLWGYLGVVPVLTGWVGNCPAYRLLGINTCGTQGS